MAATFEGWDPSMKAIISSLKSALKWKLLHFKELDKWTSGTLALLGDASHPTLPYQGQGAAMAVEDGAVIGLLLSKLQEKGLSSDAKEKDSQIAGVLKLYENLRKKRTEINVQGAVDTRTFYHLKDGPEQQNRDAELNDLNQSDWTGRSNFVWSDAVYQRDLLGFDVLADAEKRFEEWFKMGSKL
jgi:salicylate hydroxylase